jgi:hypothetical protein
MLSMRKSRSVAWELYKRDVSFSGARFKALIVLYGQVTRSGNDL